MIPSLFIPSLVPIVDSALLQKCHGLVVRSRPVHGITMGQNDEFFDVVRQEFPELTILV
jgi:hypothetical protein